MEQQLQSEAYLKQEGRMLMADQLIKVMVVEDEPIILHNIVKKIEKIDSCFKVIDSAFNGKEALNKILSLKPDVLFTDIRMPVLDGIELIKRIREESLDICVVVLSGFDDFEYAQQAIRLGVKEYLLKPLVEDQLAQTLNKIKTSIRKSYESLEISILSSRLSGQNTDDVPPSSLKDSKFSMFLICIGHLSSHLLLMSQPQRFFDFWSAIDWKEIVDELPGNIPNWWLVDEKMVNQKFLIISSQDMTLEEIKDIAEKLKNKLDKYVTPFCVNISTEYCFYPYNEIQGMAQKLRNQLEKGLVMGISKIIESTERINNDFSFQPIGSNLANTINSMITSKKYNMLNQTLFKLFQSWEESNYSQRAIEKALSQLINIFQRSSMNSSLSDVNDVEASIQEKISVSADFKSLYGFIWDSIKEVFLQEELKKEYTAELVENIEQYLKTNYTVDISLEDLAGKFNFTSAYLTKIFKKYKKESPLKYLINLRMEEAKRLMIQNRELDIKTIAELVGYYNQHYFSKVFKSLVGKTPTEYRTEKAL